MNKKYTHKLSLEQKQKIWKAYNDGYSPNEIADEFKISRATVHRIGKEEKYKN